MGRTALLLITMGALAACGSSSPSRSVAASSTSAARVLCGPLGARSLAQGSQARVFVQRQTVFACLTGERRRLTLGTTGTCIRADHVDAVAVAGRIVAAALITCGVDTGTAQIEVTRVPDGHRLFTGPAIANPGPESFTRVPGLVLTPGGSVAWIATARSIVGHRGVTEVDAGGAGGTRVLDSSAQIATGSLRLSGRTVSWQDGSARRSGQLT